LRARDRGREGSRRGHAVRKEDRRCGPPGEPQFRVDEDPVDFRPPKAGACRRLILEGRPAEFQVSEKVNRAQCIGRLREGALLLLGAGVVVDPCGQVWPDEEVVLPVIAADMGPGREVEVRSGPADGGEHAVPDVVEVVVPEFVAHRDVVVPRRAVPVAGHAHERGCPERMGVVEADHFLVEVVLLVGRHRVGATIDREFGLGGRIVGKLRLRPARKGGKLHGVPGAEPAGAQESRQGIVAGVCPVAIGGLGREAAVGSEPVGKPGAALEAGARGPEGPSGELGLREALGGRDREGLEAQGTAVGRRTEPAGPDAALDPH